MSAAEAVAEGLTAIEIEAAEAATAEVMTEAAAVSVVVVFRIPDRYEASARIYVDTQSILKPLMSGLAIEPNLDQQIMILSRTLISRPNVEKLIRMADLDLNVKTKAGQEALVDDLMKSLAIKGQPLYVGECRSRAGESQARCPGSGFDFR